MLTVTLSAVDNGDFPQPTEALRYRAPVRTFAQDIQAAIDHCQRFIAHHDLGAGHWNGGEVQRDGIAIGRVAYNGKFVEA